MSERRYQPKRQPLSDEELSLLRDVVAGLGPELNRLVDQLAMGGRLNAVDGDLLRNRVGEELASSGVDLETGAINERGLALDRLIDRVGALSDLFDQ